MRTLQSLAATPAPMHNNNNSSSDAGAHSHAPGSPALPGSTPSPFGAIGRGNKGDRGLPRAPPTTGLAPCTPPLFCCPSWRFALPKPRCPLSPPGLEAPQEPPHPTPALSAPPTFTVGTVPGAGVARGVKELQGSTPGPARFLRLLVRPVSLSPSDLALSFRHAPTQPERCPRGWLAGNEYSDVRTRSVAGTGTSLSASALSLEIKRTSFSVSSPQTLPIFIFFYGYSRSKRLRYRGQYFQWRRNSFYY